MKYLFVTDSHLTDRQPSSRTDDFAQAILAKFRDVGDLAKEHRVTAVLHGGDMFHSPAVHRGLVGDLAEILRSYPCPVYVVPGNHDLFGQNPSTLPQTMLGLLSRTGVIRILDRDHPIQESHHVIEGQPYYHGIDKHNKTADYGMQHQDVQHKLLIAHGFLLDKPFLEEIPHTLCEEVPREADMILVGHYHPGFSVHTRDDGLTIINPGSMARVDASLYSMEQPIQAVLLDIDGRKKSIDYSFLPLPSARPASEVLSRTSLVEAKEHKRSLQSFHESLDALKTNGTSFQQVLDSLLSAQNDAVRENVVQVLKNQEAAAETSDVAAPSSRRILSSMTLHNFQSHQMTNRLAFAPGMNAIFGPSDQGKSAILRAAKLLYYNEPRGQEAASFIHLGEDALDVTLTMDHGAELSRYRPKTGTGEYRVQVDGEEETFQGFGNRIPPPISEHTGHFPVTVAPGLERRLLVADQHEGLFFLGESGPARAAMIGKLSGTDTADLAVRAIGSDLLALGRDEKKHIEQCVSLEEQLTAFADLDNEEERLQAATDRLQAVRDQQQHLERLQALQKQHEEAQEQYDVSYSALRTLPDVDAVQTTLQQLQDPLRQYAALRTVFQRYERDTHNVSQYEAELAELPCIDSIAARVEALQPQLSLHERLVGLHKRFRSHRRDLATLKLQLRSDGDMEQLETLFDSLQHQMAQREQHRQLRERQTRVVTTLRGYKQEWDALRQHNQKLSQSRNDLLQQLRECPSCGQALDRSSLKHLLQTEGVIPHG